MERRSALPARLCFATPRCPMRSWAAHDVGMSDEVPQPSQRAKSAKRPRSCARPHSSLACSAACLRARHARQADADHSFIGWHAWLALVRGSVSRAYAAISGWLHCAAMHCGCTFCCFSSFLAHLLCLGGGDDPMAAIPSPIHSSHMLLLFVLRKPRSSCRSCGNFHPPSRR